MRSSVLVVEDDAGLREVLEQVLRDEGHAVTTVADGLEALEELATAMPELLVLDWSMPRLDAPGLVAALQCRGQGTQVPVLLLTAARDVDQKADAIGADGYLPKPFDLADLVEEVERLLCPRTGAAWLATTGTAAVGSAVSLQERPVGAPATPGRTMGTPEDRKTVLVVDDDPAIREMLATVLQSVGYDVDLAADGLEAIERVGRGQPALILLDVMMPRMDGITCARELTRLGLRPTIPVVIISAGGRAQQARAETGADDFLAKPFDLGTLLSTVARLAA